MWTPDIRTVFLLICLIDAFLTLMLLAYWKTQKTYDGFAIMAFSLLFQSGAYLLFMFRGSIPDLFSVVIANGLSMIALILRIDAIRRFFWLKPLPLVYYSLLAPILISYWYFTFNLDSMVLRALISTLFIVPCLIIAGVLALQSGERQNRIIRYLFAACLIVPALILIVRIVAWLLINSQYTIFSTDAFNIGFFIVAMIADILATGFFLMLNMIRSQTELQVSEAKYRTLFENMLDGTIYCKMIYDDDGRPVDWIILDTNAAFQQLIGKSDVTGKRAGEIMPSLKTEVPELFDILDRVITYGKPERFEIHFALLGRWFSSSAFSPKKDHFILIFEDITQRKQSESALRRTNEKLGLLSSITRHDIRNQLHALSGYLELSRLSVGDASRITELIGKEEGIAETIDHQINFTKDYEDMGVNAPSWQNVDAIVSHAVASLPIKGIRIEIERPELEVYADPLFGKVFYNLIDNALRYGGDRMTRIRISSQETSTGLIITCEDDGVGITDEERKRLFERGYGKHTGLGLFLSREILSITDITITENGETGKGARLEMVVPKGEYRFG